MCRTLPRGEPNLQPTPSKQKQLKRIIAGVFRRVWLYLQPQSSSASPGWGPHVEGAGAGLGVLFFSGWTPMQRRGDDSTHGASARVRGAPGAVKVPTNLLVTGAEVGGDAPRRGHGRLGGAPLLPHVRGPLGTGSDPTVCTGARWFAQRRRNWGAQRSFLEGKERFQQQGEGAKKSGILGRTAGRTSSAFFFPFRNKLRNPAFFLGFRSAFGSSTETGTERVINRPACRWREDAQGVWMGGVPSAGGATTTLVGIKAATEGNNQAQSE